MGDPRRFHEFAKIVKEHIPLEYSIADIAGGKGYLQAALRQIGYKDVTSWDKRKRYAASRKGYRYGYFEWENAPKYNAVVAMHPDEGTDHAILYAAKHKVPAIICPCCITPSASVFSEKYNYTNWKKHLTKIAETKGCEVQWIKLKINGRNDVMVIKPKEKI